MDVCLWCFCGEWWSVGDRSVMRLKCANFLKYFCGFSKRERGLLKQSPFWLVVIKIKLELVSDLDAELAGRLEEIRLVIGAGQDVLLVVDHVRVVEVARQRQEVELGRV